MEYNSGDKVLIRSDLVVGKIYGNCGFSYWMRYFLGKEVTINDYYGNGEYSIIEDEGESRWHASMFVWFRETEQIDGSYDDVPIYSVSEIMNFFEL